MEISEQPRRLGGRLVATGAILALAVVWATVALASGSGSGSSSPSSGSTGGQGPAAATYDGDPYAQFAANGVDGECPDDDRGSTLPSTPSTPTTPSTADGSTDPTL